MNRHASPGAVVQMSLKVMCDWKKGIDAYCRQYGVSRNSVELGLKCLGFTWYGRSKHKCGNDDVIFVKCGKLCPRSRVQPRQSAMKTSSATRQASPKNVSNNVSKRQTTEELEWLFTQAAKFTETEQDKLAKLQWEDKPDVSVRYNGLENGLEAKEVVFVSCETEVESKDINQCEYCGKFIFPESENHSMEDCFPEWL